MESSRPKTGVVRAENDNLMSENDGLTIENGYQNGRKTHVTKKCVFLT